MKNSRKTKRPSVRIQAEALIRKNVRAVIALDEAAQESRTFADRVIDGIAAFCGSLTFVYIHAIWFGLWLLLNIQPIPLLRFDPFPFSLLTLVVSLEAIFLSTFILMSQNRQQRISDLRNHLDLQINLLAEQESTKMLRMLEAIENRLGIEQSDPTVEALEQATRPEKVVREIERTVESSRINGEGI